MDLYHSKFYGIVTKKYRKKVDIHDSRTWRQRTGVKTLSHTPPPPPPPTPPHPPPPPPPPPHPTSLLYYPSEFWNRKGTGHTRKNTENTWWKHHHRNFNGSAQYVDTATTLLPCNRAPATNGQSTNMTSQTHVNISTKHADTTAVQHTQHHGNTAVIPQSFKMNNVEYIWQSVSKTSQQRTNIISTGRTITL